MNLVEVLNFLSEALVVVSKYRTRKSDQKLLAIGGVGSIILAICCFTPALVIAFGVIGLSAWIGFVDVVLLPGLFIFIGLTGYALWRLRSN